MKVAIWLLVLSLAFAAVFFGHAIWSGVLLPYPDPTPELAAKERFHRPISSAHFLATAGSSAAYLVAAVVAICAWVVRKLGARGSDE